MPAQAKHGTNRAEAGAGRGEVGTQNLCAPIWHLDLVGCGADMAGSMQMARAPEAVAAGSPKQESMLKRSSSRPWLDVCMSGTHLPPLVFPFQAHSGPGLPALQASSQAALFGVQPCTQNLTTPFATPILLPPLLACAHLSLQGLRGLRLSRPYFHHAVACAAAAAQGRVPLRALDGRTEALVRLNEAHTQTKTCLHKMQAGALARGSTVTGACAYTSLLLAWLPPTNAAAYHCWRTPIITPVMVVVAVATRTVVSMMMQPTEYRQSQDLRRPAQTEAPRPLHTCW